MAKNKRRSTPPPAAPASPKLSWSFRAKRVMVSGLMTVFFGFVVLSFADPAGQNWAATLSPFLLVFGYTLVGISLAFRHSASVVPSASK